MTWSDFYDNFTEWAESTLRSRISSLEDIGTGDDVVDAVLNIDDEKIRAQLIRKAIKLGAKFNSEDFQNLEDELPTEAYAELGRYVGFDADNPTYDQADTSWSHFYDYFTDWSPEVQKSALQRLTKLGKRDEVVDAILSLDGMEDRVLLIRKAIAARVKFSHEDFENLQGELPVEVYRELAAYTGHSAECPDYDKNNHTWKYFYENGCGWTEEIQLAAIASLSTIGGQRQVTETILELNTDAPKAALISRAIEKNIMFSRESLQDLDGSIPQNLFQKLLQRAGISEDDLYFDDANMTWDDFECSYSDWGEELLAKRIGKLKDFGDPEAVCDAIQAMPSSELEDALYERAVKRGVKFTEEQLEDMGHVEPQLKNALDNFITDEQINQVAHDVEVINARLDEEYPILTPEQQRKENVKGVFKFLGAIAAAIFGIFAVFLGVIFGLTKNYSGGSRHHKSTFGRSGKSTSKKKGRYCDGDCANCPPHYGYRYGRWYYGHGHQWGCERGGDGGRRGLTLRD